MVNKREGGEQTDLLAALGPDNAAVVNRPSWARQPGADAFRGAGDRRTVARGRADAEGDAVHTVVVLERSAVDDDIGVRIVHGCNWRLDRAAHFAGAWHVSRRVCGRDVDDG